MSVTAPRASDAATSSSDGENDGADWPSPFMMHALLWAGFKVLTNPLDRMKVLLQTQLEVCSSLTPHERSLLPHDLGTVRGMAEHVWRTERIGGLWRGSMLGWLSSLLHSGGTFWVMSWIDWFVRPSVGDAAFDTKDPRMTRRMFASGVGGFFLSLVLYPIDVTRSVRMADLRFPQSGRIAFQHNMLIQFFEELRAGRFVFRTVPTRMLEDASPQRIGFLQYACLWRGYMLSLVGMMAYRGIHLFMASLAMSVVINRMNGESDGPTALQELGLGFTITVAATAVVYPLDVLRSRFVRLGFVNAPIMAAGGEYLPVKDMAVMIWRREGIRGFYRGASFALTMRAATLAAAAFGVPMLANWIMAPPRKRAKPIGW
jgi:hypothetical protein